MAPDDGPAMRPASEFLISFCPSKLNGSQVEIKLQRPFEASSSERPASRLARGYRLAGELQVCLASELLLAHSSGGRGHRAERLLLWSRAGPLEYAYGMKRE